MSVKPRLRNLEELVAMHTGTLEDMSRVLKKHARLLSELADLGAEDEPAQDVRDCTEEESTYTPAQAMAEGAATISRLEEEIERLDAGWCNASGETLEKALQLTEAKKLLGRALLCLRHMRHSNHTKYHFPNTIKVIGDFLRKL